MTIKNIMLLGNWELCLTIINAYFPAGSRDEESKCCLTVLTYPSQTLGLPNHVPPTTIEHKKSDYTSASLLSAFAGQDLVVSTMSGGDSGLQLRIIDAAIAAGVKRFVPHEFGYDTLNDEIRKRITKYAGRGRVIDHLKKTSKANADFEWVGIATGYTLDTNLISGDLGLDMEWHSATIHGIGTEAFAASSLQRVGEVVKSVIAHWDEAKNQYIYASGVITSANEILRSAEKVTGREFTVGNYDVEECIREGEARIEKGYPDSGMFLLERSVLYDERLDASSPFKLKSANKTLHLPPELVEDIVGRAYHDLKHHGKPGCGCSA